jgi:predicted RNA-binding protein YlxR (DUF448 family)
MSAGTNAPKTQRRKGPRPKHVPQRMCIACRERSSKRSLTRVVRTPEGPVVVDPTGKRNGRGAYLCDDRKCWERAITSNMLSHALKTEIDADTAAVLRGHAATLPERDDSAAAVTQEG